jgi:hypothetical protein
MRVANAIEEEAVVVNDGKVACDMCGKRYKVNGLNITRKIIY